MSAKFKPGDLVATIYSTHLYSLGVEDARLSLPEFYREVVPGPGTKSLFMSEGAVFVLIEVYEDRATRVYRIRLLHPEHGLCNTYVERLEEFRKVEEWEQVT